MTGRGPMRAQYPAVAPPARPGSRAVSVSGQSPRCEDTADISEITNENESDALSVSQGSCGEERKKSNSESVMAAVKTEGAGFKRNSFLRRSDSYRRAKTSNVLLTPDMDKRKSVEVTTVVNNNNKTDPMISEKQLEKPKNNFFRSLRSSLSFSSLRVKKSQQRPRLNISNPLEAQNSGVKNREVMILHSAQATPPSPFPPLFSPCIQMNYLLRYSIHSQPRVCFWANNSSCSHYLDSLSLGEVVECTRYLSFLCLRLPTHVQASSRLKTSSNLQ